MHLTRERTTWQHDRTEAAEYAARRLGADHRRIDPGDFGVVWANMRKGHRFGELRVLPALAEAFEDWLAEHR